MKTVLYYAALLLLLFFATSCGKQSKTEPLSGNPALSTFTTTEKTGQSLTGVVHQTGDIIIQPAAYKSVTADSYTITCTRMDGLQEVFKANGEPIGIFEMFTRWTANGDYYLGVRYLENTYYFPKKNLVLSSRQTHKEQNILLISCEEGWNIYDYEGNFLWNAPAKMGIIKNAKIPTKQVIAIESNDKKPSCTLYNTDGSAYKAIPPAKWAQLKKGLKNIKQLSPEAYAAASDDFDKF